MANINEVAKIAGVSKSTVSYVLSGKKYVSPEITDRVRKACAKVDYTVSFFASNILSNKSNIIGLFFEPENKHFYSFYNDLIRSCILELGSHDMQVIPYFGLSCAEVEKLLKASAAPIVGAIVVTPIVIDNRIQLLGRNRLPMVLIGESEQSSNKLPSVDIDNRNLVLRVFGYAYDTGHRKILFINSHIGLTISKQRQAALAELNYEGLEVNEVNASVANGIVYKMLKENIPNCDTYDCVVVASEISARDVYRYFEEKGKRIGKDISVMALGGESYSDFVPKLTGAKQDYLEIGKHAVSLLLKLIDGGEDKTEQILIKSGFEEGESVSNRNLSK